MGESFLNYDYPQLLAVDYMDFTRTGNRKSYQDKAFDRRLALDALVLAECAEANGRFLDDIINGLVLLCEESAWQIPAHNSYVRDTPQLILPDTKRPVIDLFAAETGAVLGVAEALLRPLLKAVSPFLSTMIDEHLYKRIITPYLTRHFWWMGDGISPMNNWTVWCTQNVLLSVFTRDMPADMQMSIIQKACKSTDYFLDEYGEDGCCDEGAQYYRHAGLCLFNIIEILNEVTDNTFESLYQNKKIQNIASYIWNVHVDDRYYLNFADCSPLAGRCNAREFLFAKRTGNSNLMAFAAEDLRRSEEPLLPKEHNLYYRIQAIFHHQEMLTYLPDTPPSHKDCFYESTGLWIARDSTTCLSVKAGDNNDSHNHNDVGSFTLYRHGRPMFLDVGVETYTKKTFSKERYELWPMQSGYHNLITFGGIMERNGKEYASGDVAVSFEDGCASISMELSGAYPSKQIRSYRRLVTFQKDRQITIRDTIDTDLGPNVLSLMTCEKPSWHASGNRLQIGSLGSLQISGCSHVHIEQITITDETLARAWKHAIYRTLITIMDQELLLEIPLSYAMDFAYFP